MPNIQKPLVAIVLFFSLALALDAAPSQPRGPKPAPGLEAYNQGSALLMELDYAKAERHLRRALRQNAEMAEAHNNLAFVLRKQGEDHYAEALKHYNEAARLSPDLAEPYMYRGVLLVAMGDKEAALKDHTRLLELGSPLAAELEYVIQSGAEKTPEQFFGVTAKK